MGEGKWLFRDEARLALTMVEAHDGYVGVCAAIFFSTSICAGGLLSKF